MRWWKLAAVGIYVIVAYDGHELADEDDAEAGAAAPSAHGKVSPGKVGAKTVETIDFFVDPLAYIEHHGRALFFPAAGAAATSADGQVSPDKVAADPVETIDFFADPEGYVKLNWKSVLMPCAYAFLFWQWWNKPNKDLEPQKLAFADEDGDDVNFELDGSTLTCSAMKRTWTGKWTFDNKTGLLKCEEKKRNLIVKVPKDKRAEVLSLVEKSKGSIGAVQLKSDDKETEKVD